MRRPIVKAVNLFCVFFLLAINQACSDDTVINEKIRVSEKIACLEEFVSKKNMTKGEKERLFKCFPENSKELVLVFNQQASSPALGDGFAIIGQRIPEVKDVVGPDRYAKKLIGAAIGLDGFADTPNYLRYIFYTEFKKRDAEVFFNQLDNLNDEHIASFWVFYFRTWEGIELNAEICNRREDRKSCKVLASMIEDQG